MLVQLPGVDIRPGVQDVFPDQNQPLGSEIKSQTFDRKIRRVVIVMDDSGAHLGQDPLVLGRCGFGSGKGGQSLDQGQLFGPGVPEENVASLDEAKKDSVPEVRADVGDVVFENLEALGYVADLALEAVEEDELVGVVEADETFVVQHVNS